MPTPITIYETWIVPTDFSLDYVVGPGDDTGAIWLSGQPEFDPGQHERYPLDPTLVNHGVLSGTNLGGPNQFDDMIVLWISSGTFWHNVVVENHGLISSNSRYGEARAFSSSSWSPSIINTGTMIAISPEGLARTLFSYGLNQPYGPFFQPFYIHNTATGEIIADASQAFAVATPFANLINDGLIQAIGHDVSGIGVRSNGGYIENNGQIIATADAGATSWGIALGLFDAFNGPRHSTIINTGLIQASIAIDELYDGGVRTSLLNQGQIVGSIRFYDGDDTITNQGSITGSIELGDGNDLFDGRGGSVTGAIFAGTGDDTIYLGDQSGGVAGGDGNDILTVDFSAEVAAVAFSYDASGGAFTLAGQLLFSVTGIEHFIIYAGSGYDDILTGDSDDVIDLGLGGGAANGGGGRDRVVLDFSDRAGIVVYSHDAEEAIATVGGAAAAVVRNAEDISITGGANADQLTGGEGDDVLAGGGGADVLNGAEGFDIASYADSAAGVQVALEGGASGGDATGDSLVNFEGLIGSDFADTITGNGGANHLDGSGGPDLMTGGAGDDTYYVDNAADQTIEHAGQGVDAVYARVSFTLMAEVEHGFLLGADALNLTGNALANTLIGNSGNNTLIGGAGGDILNGGAGFDVVSYAWSPSAVTINLTTGVGQGGDAEGDHLQAFESLVGSAHNDTLRGSSLSDWIEGGAGADYIDGGAGYDTVSYTFSAVAVHVNLSTQLCSGGDATGDVLLNIEGLTGSAWNDVLIGNNSTSLIEGLDGDDLISGGYANNRLDGGNGFDTASFLFVNRGVTVDLSRDLAAVSNLTHTLISIEGVIGSEYDDLLIGDEGDNQLEGAAGADNLIGGDGDDTLIGGEGADSLNGDAGADTVSYAGSSSAVIIDLASGASWDGTLNDTFVSIENAIGSDFNDTFYGTNGDNTFTGGLGADTLLGADGIDTADYASSSAGVTVNLRTGAGSGGEAAGDTYSLIENAIGSAFNDTFVSSAAANTFVGGAGRDTISYAGSSAGVIVHMQAGLTWDGAVNDVISGIENIVGGAGDDQLWGDAGDNLIDGGVGGADVLAGFGGFDTVSYANSATGVIIDMGSSLTWDGVVNDQLHAFHGAIGSAHNDDFRGTGGVDVLDGGAGQDLYLGNDDADTFVFRAGQANGDTVVDFAGQGAVTGDSFVFVGYGAGATFTQIDATHWLITSGNGLITETITLANSASVHASDYTFVDSYIVGGG